MRRYLPYAILIFSILLNLYLFYPETTILSDPNDNIFAFGMINRMEKTWEENCRSHFPISLFQLPHCLSALLDHWNSEWAEGYPLPFYYSHLPQLLIVSSYKLFSPILSFLPSNPSNPPNPFSPGLYSYFNLIKYLVLSFFPLSIFLAFRLFGFSKWQAAIAALLSTHLSTDGLYGMDITSFLWRGYGLSSQLFSFALLPLALAFVYRTLKRENTTKDPGNRRGEAWRDKDTSEVCEALLGWWRKLQIPSPRQADQSARSNFDFPLSVFFLFLTISFHLGTGYIAVLSTLPFIFINLNLRAVINRGLRLFLILAATFFFLSYWLVPLFLNNEYHLVSFWDPIWKFDSFGAKEIINQFLDGTLMDFGRLPVFTILTLVGFFFALNKNQGPLLPLSLLFPFWFLLFFGRKTWGPIFNFIPGMEDYHLHRFINGLHLSALFLAPLGLSFLLSQDLRKIPGIERLKFRVLGSRVIPFFILLLTIFLVYPRTFDYVKYNTLWIKEQNQVFKNGEKDFNNLLNYLKNSPSGRIYAGRPGNWGHQFKIGDTPLYMALSVRGFPVVDFLPETWSPNSDNENYFDERLAEHFNLYNIRYVIAPSDVTFPKFIQKKTAYGPYNVYEVNTSGYFDIVGSNLRVLTDKRKFVNLVHLWQQSTLVAQKNHPLIFLKEDSNFSSLPKVEMTDEVTYKKNGGVYNIFAASPLFPLSATPSGEITSETVKAQAYSAKIKVNDSCQSCFALFKMTYHPNWQITVDGKSAQKYILFPFYMGISINSGEHEIMATYKPSGLKIFLLLLEGFGPLFLVLLLKSLKSPKLP